MRRLIPVLAMAAGGCLVTGRHHGAPPPTVRLANPVLVVRLAEADAMERLEQDLLNLSRALESFRLAVAERSPTAWEERPALTPDAPEWACDTCGVARPGKPGDPSDAPLGTCHRCGGLAVEDRHPIAGRAERGRYPTADEGLEVLLPLLHGIAPAPDLVDPWGRPYRYLPDDAAGYGTPGIPRGGYLLYSVGPNGLDESGSGDDLSNLPSVSPRHEPPTDWFADAHLHD